MDDSEAEPTCFDVLADLFARDVDRALLQRALKKTPTERLAWLQEMQAFAEQAKEARKHEADRAADSAR